MSDQYDDGRYDGWGRNMGIPPSPRPGSIVAAGGWCIPASQAPEPLSAGRYYPDGILQPPPRPPAPELHPRYGIPIQAVRGGIKYPKSAEAQRRESKETHMPEPRMTKAQIEHELRTNTELMTALRHRRNQLKKAAQKAIPAEPHGHTMFTVSVRFKMRGQRYQFLILKSGGHYWTTGTRQDQQVFSSWESLCDWLEGPDVYDHTDIEILSSAHKVVSFDSGAIEQLPTQQPPF